MCGACAECCEGGPETLASIKTSYKKAVGQPPYLLDARTGQPIQKDGKKQEEFISRADALKRFAANKRAAYKKDGAEVRYYNKTNGTGCYAGTLKNPQGESCKNVEQNKAICDGNATDAYPIIQLQAQVLWLPVRNVQQRTAITS